MSIRHLYHTQKPARKEEEQIHTIIVSLMQEVSKANQPPKEDLMVIKPKQMSHPVTQAIPSTYVCAIKGHPSLKSHEKARPHHHQGSSLMTRE